MIPFELKKAISDLQSALDGHKNVAFGSFASKLRKVGSSYPEDQTINQMSIVVDRMNNGERLFISRAEINDLYNKLYTRNTKFKEVFAEELGLEAPVESSESRTQEKFEEFDIYGDTDKTLLASLNSIFDPEIKAFSNEIARDAEKVVSMECSFPNLEPTVKAISGDENVVVVSATYKTPKGQASLYIPVEIMNKKASIPSFFTGRDGQHYISRKSIASYVDNFFNKVGSFGDEVEGYSELKEPEVSSEEIESFASQLSSVKGVASFQHGELAEHGRKIISQRIKGFGKKSFQVNIIDSDKKSITYGVNCDGTAFKVPVKIEGGRLQDPSIILCNGSIESFTSDGLLNLQKNELSDNQVAAVVSPLYDFKASELVEIVRSAGQEGNYVKAEDALNILAHMNDDKAYKIAFIEYTSSLSGAKKEASTTKCSRVIKTANSNQPVCSHLNLPLNKVYQDKHGSCRPLSRKGIEDSNEGTCLLNSKIIF